MDYKRAKEVIKNNYPPENYTELRETLEWLIEQAEKAEELERSGLKIRQLATEEIEKQQKELNEASELIKKVYKFLGTNESIDFQIWKETEKYCKEKKLF